ncbi:hypothetical protein WJX72_011728 [[Myrmecia] bisecta]|uniref:RING-type domain-containing protein n=1 Tax=[Myrmecia] bisecta TaxID=41462 RepID=A0AAW1PR20_9CHLO
MSHGVDPPYSLQPTARGSRTKGLCNKVMARGRGVPGRANQDEEEKFCPLCIEPLDSTEQQFYPCPCGYQLCLFCYDRIKLECSNLFPDQLQALWGAVSLPGLDPAAERPRGRLPLYARGGDTAATDSSGDGPFGSEQQANGCASPTATSRAQEQASGGAAFLDAADLAANGLGFVSSGYRSDGPGVNE